MATDTHLPVFRSTLGVLLTLIVFLAGTTAQAETRWALVLGNSEYDHAAIPDLPNTINDARTMSAALNNMGFEVYYLEDTTKAEIDRTLTAISTEQRDADLGLFYYAGHGLQLDGQNFILPSDIIPEQTDFLHEQGVSVNDIVRDLSGFGTKNLVVILDSCRNSPFPELEAVGTGLALVDAPANTIIAYSTAPGAVALDGAGANSPYTAALASVLDGPEQDIRDILRLVRARVRLATGGAQTPWFIDNSRSEIVIHPRRAVDVATLGETLGRRVISLATTAWKTIIGSADPRDFEQFAAMFPADDLAPVAKRQLLLIGEDSVPSFPLMDLAVDPTAAEVPDGLNSIITACDILATGVGDIRALVEPVPHDLVNTRAALRACVEAVNLEPENARLITLLARVLRLEGRYDEALFYFQKAADLGHPTAFSGLTAIYREGIGVEPDYARAFAAARQGALLGSPNMQLVTGVFYREGWGVEQSFTEARRWMQLAIRNGFPHAMVAYGDFYRKGWGVDADPARAVEYYRKAAALGSSDAVNLVGMAYMRGQGLENDTDAGIRWLVRASDEGNPYAAYQLGIAFVRAWGVETNLDTALAYFRLSAQRNYLGAYIQIGDILAQDPAQLSEAYANYIIAREAAKVRDSLDAADELDEANAKLADVSARMDADQRAAGERIAKGWIDQYGLLDFNLVSE